MTTDFGRCLTARATHAPHRANLRCLGLSVGIAIALGGCDGPTPQQIAQREAQRAYDDYYDHCLYRVTGPFASASFDVMKECDRQARVASGMSTGTAKTPQAVEGQSPASPVGNAETPNLSRPQGSKL